MEFRLLGPVELWVAGRRVEVGPQQRRAVLAALLVDAGRPVSPQTLVDRVWDKAPASARRALHAHITRIRRLLKGTGTELVRHSGGYVLGVDPECVDLHRFHRLSPTEPRAALDLWHGAALADLTGSWAVRTRWNWQQQRVDTTVRWTVAEVRLGRPDRVIEAMRDLAEEHPLSEPVAEALIAAFVAAGRSAEALGQYEEIRVRLVEELGADPARGFRSYTGRSCVVSPLSAGRRRLCVMFPRSFPPIWPYGRQSSRSRPVPMTGWWGR